jgi:hypothetical protein
MHLMFPYQWNTRHVTYGIKQNQKTDSSNKKKANVPVNLICLTLQGDHLQKDLDFSLLVSIFV